MIDDGTRGVFVRRPPPPPDLEIPAEGVDPWFEVGPGMKMELRGITEAGNFAPVAIARQIRILGEAPLPPAPLTRLADLLSGSYDCQRVALRGVLQDLRMFRWPEDQVRFSLATPDGRCEIISRDEPPPDAPPLIDAEVEIEGVCYSFFNPRGELVGVRLHIPDTGAIRVIVPAPPDPFDVPEVSLRNLRSFSVNPRPLNRRKFSGIVTLCRPGEFLYVQTEDRGVKVQTRQQGVLVPGTRVDVSGFIETQSQFAEFHDAVFEITGAEKVPEAIPIDLDDVTGDFDGNVTRNLLDVDGRLVTLSGRLIQIERSAPFTRLYVESDGAVLSAEYHDPDGGKLEIPPGSDLELTGICKVELSSSWPAREIPRVTGFQLLLRTPSDISITRKASWWTPYNLWKVLTGLFAITITALVWALMLRRKVEQERDARREEGRAGEAAKLEFAATIRERERLAADLHDTLEQALTGVAFQLETLNRLRGQPVERSERHLAFARQILARSREDVRRSVWNLRANILEGRMLREALEFIAQGLAEGSDIEITIAGTGEEVALPDLIGGNLLMLSKESITNALKHSDATRINMIVDYLPGVVILTIEDNGRGFDPSLAAGPQSGHFGLQGMRERTLRIGGTLDIDSTPGRGTRISMRVEL